ncbi:MAG: response regulator transcription factor [Chitinophagaceae bacterium]
MEYSIAIVDDHILIAKAIASIINEDINFKVLYEVANGKKLQEKFLNKKLIPDIVLLDISMPIMDGFETALWLKKNHPDVIVLTLSMQDDDQSLIRMIKNGAKGYLLKNVEPKELLNALHEVVNKGYFYPEWAASKVFIALGEDEPKKITMEFQISERELEFLQWACSELTYKEIGQKMFVSSRTVEGYRDSLFLKLGINTRVGLVIFAMKNRLVEV